MLGGLFSALQCLLVVAKECELRAFGDEAVGVCFMVAAVVQPPRLPWQQCPHTHFSQSACVGEGITSPYLVMFAHIL